MAPTITVDFSKLPTAAEEDQAKKFQVVKNYLRNIYDYISWHYGGNGFSVYDKLLEAQRALPNFQKIRRRTADVNEMKRRLWNAWAAEIQLNIGESDDQPTLLPYSNAWAPVHAYYAVYMSMHALFLAMGLDSPRENHAGSLNVMSRSIIARDLMPLPWSVTCGGCPQTKERTVLGLPPNVDPDVHVELLANPSIETFWPRFAKMLEKTREERLERAFDGWKRQKKRKAMKKDEKRVIASKLPPTSVFEYFLRLRLRSNYQDVRSYVMSAVSTEWHRQFHSSLRRATATTCLLLESLMTQYAGANVLDEACTEFLGGDSIGGLNKFIEIRRDKLLG